MVVDEAITRKIQYQKCKDGATLTFPVFLFPHKHANIHIYRNFMQGMEAYEDHCAIIKAPKKLYNTTILWGTNRWGSF